MTLTLLSTLICIEGVFLMLFAEVAFIQDKRYLGTRQRMCRRRFRFMGSDSRECIYLDMFSASWRLPHCVLIENRNGF